jgi:hypothetical protein
MIDNSLYGKMYQIKEKQRFRNQFVRGNSSNGRSNV